MTRALFTFGRGPQAPLIGSLVDIRTGPGPSTMAELCAGWRMLTATGPDDYSSAIGDLFALWRAAGGHVEPRPTDPLPHDLAPYPDGSLPCADYDPPVFPHFGMVYAFDQGVVWFWRDNRWKQITDLELTADEPPSPRPHHGHYE